MSSPKSSAKLIDLGEYADDARLVEHGERYASFYGAGCSPAVTVRASLRGSGFHASQHRSALDGEVLVMAEPTVFADGATAAEALAQIIGPVQRADGAA